MASCHWLLRSLPLPSLALAKTLLLACHCTLLHAIALLHTIAPLHTIMPSKRHRAVAVVQRYAMAQWRAKDKWHVMARWRRMVRLHFVTAMACDGVRWQAMVHLPEPETAATMLYGGVGSTIGGVGGVDTDGNNVIQRSHCGWWGCCKAASARPQRFGEWTQQQSLVV